jgi:hypothetical protein
MGTRVAQAVENVSTAFFMSNLLLSSPRSYPRSPCLYIKYTKNGAPNHHFMSSTIDFSLLENTNVMIKAKK